MIYNPKRGDENPAPFTGPPTDEEQNVCAVRNTVEPLYNGHLRTEFSGRCKEVAVMGRLSIRGFE